MTTMDDAAPADTGRSWWGARLWGRLEYPAYIIRRNPVTLFGFSVIVLLVIIALAAPLIATHDPLAVSPANTLEPPSRQSLFGTDQYGRDVFSRIIYATRLDLFIALTSVDLAFAVGTVLGALAGYFAGLADNLLMRLVDVIMAFPPFILAMGTAAALGAGTANIIYVVALIQAPIYVRLARGEILSAKERPYAEAAHTMGQLCSGASGSGGRQLELGDLERRRPELHWSGGTPTHTGMGRDDQRRNGVHVVRSLVAVLLPRPGHRHHHPGLQLAGRRIARRV